MEKLFLASASPRRQRILALLGLPFQEVPVKVNEAVWPGEGPAQAAMRMAQAKAQAAAGTVSQGIIIAADTLVVNKGHILGKPRDTAQARRMLRRLRGRAHLVITGLAVLRPATGEAQSAAVTTRVWMRPYTDAELEAYAASGEALDKAGAYAIQSPSFAPVERIAGCYLNVVGLPLCALGLALRQLGLQTPAEEICYHIIGHDALPAAETMREELSREPAASLPDVLRLR